MGMNELASPQIVVWSMAECPPGSGPQFSGLSGNYVLDSAVYCVLLLECEVLESTLIQPFE